MLDLTTVRGAQNRREVWRFLVYLRQNPDARVTPQQWFSYRTLIPRLRGRPRRFANGQKIDRAWATQLILYSESQGLVVRNRSRGGKVYWTADREACRHWRPDWDTDGRRLKRRQRPAVTDIFEGVTSDA